MESYADNAPLIVVVGPTASGKTALSLELARRFNGEIIAADSRTVYKGMDIGTAKPTAEEMAAVPHHLVNVVTPDEPFNVHQFQQRAEAAIHDIVARGRLPIVVGGTGLYIDAVIYGFRLSGGPADPAQRAALEQCSVEELRGMIAARGLHLPVNDRNPRHLVRVLERNGAAVAQRGLRPHTVIIGLDVDRDELRQKVTLRVQAMIAHGLVEEVRRLGEQYGWDTPALQAPAYKAFRPYIEGRIGLEEAAQLFVQQDMQYAKRQKTWFRRNKSIQWISKTAESVDIVTTVLNK